MVWAGILPYFSEREAVDLLGKNDRRIARGPNHFSKNPIVPFFASAPVPYLWPGHTKHDYHYSIETLLPDIVAQQFDGMTDVEATLRQRYSGCLFEGSAMFIRNDSPEVDFQRIPTGS